MKVCSLLYNLYLWYQQKQIQSCMYHTTQQDSGWPSLVKITTVIPHSRHLIHGHNSLDMGAWFGRNFLQPAPQTGLRPKLYILTIVAIKLKLWPVAGCEAIVVAKLSSRPLGEHVVGFKRTCRPEVKFLPHAQRESPESSCDLYEIRHFQSMFFILSTLICNIFHISCCILSLQVQALLF